MPKLIQHNEIEYDFDLTFDDGTNYKVGNMVSSPARDSTGKVVTFIGSGVIVAITREWSPEDKTTIYVKQYPAF